MQTPLVPGRPGMPPGKQVQPSGHSPWAKIAVHSIVQILTPVRMSMSRQTSPV